MKWINDRVHGGITLDHAEINVLDTPTFQRLRHLKQLSFLDYVFPGGEHSRFEHSLGALHVMGRMIQQLGIPAKDDQARYLRVAAMLHDVGHYPFSHLGEFAYAALTRADSIVESANLGVSKLVDAMNMISGAHDLHEKLSSILIENREDLDQALRRNGLDPQQVAAYLQEDFSEAPHLKQMLHSDLDCDRLDYLVRDATAVGVRYGLVDVDYIVHTLQFADFDESTKLLTISPKGIPAVEHYLIARFLHYKGVVCHKTVMSFEVVARAILLEMIKKERVAPFGSIEEVEQLASNGDDRILRFTDSFFYERLVDYRDRLTARGETALPEYAYAVSILERIRPRTVFEVEFLEGTAPSQYLAAKDLIDTQLELLARTIGVDVNLVGYVEREVKFCDRFLGKPEEEMDTFIKSVKVKTNDRGIIAIQGVTESLIHSMVEHRWKVFRIFYVEPVVGAKPDFKKARDDVTALIRSEA